MMNNFTMPVGIKAAINRPTHYGKSAPQRKPDDAGSLMANTKGRGSDSNVSLITPFKPIMGRAFNFCATKDGYAPLPIQTACVTEIEREKCGYVNPVRDKHGASTIIQRESR